ncbi:MAG: hypothetical protein ACLU6Y_09970 [Ruminococcus sp.]
MKTLLHLQTPMSRTIHGDGFKINEIGYLLGRLLFRETFRSVDEIVMSGFLGRMGLRPFIQ